MRFNSMTCHTAIDEMKARFFRGAWVATALERSFAISLGVAGAVVLVAFGP